MTPDPSPLTLHVTTVTALCIESDARPTSQHDSLAQTMTKAGMTPHATSKHDDDHIHRASLIQGLPPENKLHIGQHQDNHNKNSTQPQNQEKRKNTTKARLTPQNHQNQHNPIKTGNMTQRDYRAELIDPLAPPPPPDASKGPEAVIQAIDAWFEYQDCLKSAQKPTTNHLPDAEERNTAETTTDRPPMDQQPEANSQQSKPKELTLQQGINQAKMKTKWSQDPWSKGFLNTTKTPKGRTRTTTPHYCQYPTNIQTNNIPGTEPREFNKGTNVTSTLDSSKAPPETSSKAAQSDKLSVQGPTFLQQYDARMQLSGANWEIYSEWEAITNFFLQLQTYDDQIQVVPWLAKDQNQLNPPIAITSIGWSFFNLHTYIPHLASKEASLKTRMALGNT